MTKDEAKMMGSDTLECANIRVLTVKPEKESTDWVPEVLKERQWGIEGVIIHYHNSHGKTYEVLHPDGTVGHYEPRELQLI